MSHAPASSRQPAPSCSSLAAIAEAAGVSRMTVSRALRNAGYTARATRERVLAAVERLGYRPNPLVSALMTQIHHGKVARADNVIAYLTSSRARGGWRENDTYRLFFEGAQARAAQLGYRLEEFWLGERAFSFARLSRTLFTRGIRGVIVGPMGSSHGHLSLNWRHVSAVAIGHTLLRPALDRVSNDQFDSAVTALRALRRLGYTRVGMALDGRTAARVHHRWPAVFFMGQWLRGPIDDALLYMPDHWERRGFCAWVRETGLEAVVSPDPEVYPWLVEEGYRVPGDIAVASLDRPPGQTFLAGIDQRSAAVGGVAASVVVSRINNNEFGLPTHPRVVALPGEWVDGTTVPRAVPARRGRGRTPAGTRAKARQASR